MTISFYLSLGPQVTQLLDSPCSSWIHELSSQESYALSPCVSLPFPLLCHHHHHPGPINSYPQLSIPDPVTDKFTESVYVLANEPSVALYRLQEHVRRSLPELAQHKVSPGCSCPCPP